MSFKKNKYIVIKNAVSKEITTLLYNYFLVRKKTYDTMIEHRYISPFEKGFGYYETHENQVPNTFAIYGDVLFDVLMLKIQPIMEKATKLKLQSAYTYGRIYKKGDVLKRHKDRFSCEISTTMNLGGDNWPIYLSPNENVGIPDGKKITLNSQAKGIKVDLKPGDMLIYSGCELEHWRNAFKGKECAQLFLHYNNVKTKDSKKYLFDRKPHIGLPGWFIGKC